MTIISKTLIGTAGLAAMFAVASPAAAQGYPYGGYNNNSGGVVGAIINSVTGGGYGQYPQGNYGYNQSNQRNAVGQCAAAAEQRLNYRGQSGYGNQGYSGYQNGYGSQGYGYAQGGARVVGITNVERRGNGGLRVTGVASSGAIAPHDHPNQGYGNRGYGNQGYGNQGYANQGADLRFSCRVNNRGQVTDVNINRIQTAYRGGY